MKTTLERTDRIITMSFPSATNEKRALFLSREEAETLLCSLIASPAHFGDEENKLMARLVEYARSFDR